MRTKGKFLPAAMRWQEYAVMADLLRQHQPDETLEIGMANGQSTLEFCRYHAERGRGNHTAIDPFQSDPKFWNGEGLALIRDAGLSNYLEVIEEMNFLALPKLVERKCRFQMVLIDGYHSFDYAFIDFFFADLLLDPGGIVVFHDTGMPSVCKVCHFLECNKPYDRVSPAPSVELKALASRALRRLGQLFLSPEGHRQIRARREHWFSLTAYRKRADSMCAEQNMVNF